MNPAAPVADAPERKPLSSQAAAGCLALPALTGGCMAVLWLCLLVMGAVSWTISMLFGHDPRGEFSMGEVKPHHDVVTWTWFLTCLMAFRAMMTSTRRPWVYWLTAACLAFSSFLALGSTAMTVAWPGLEGDAKVVAGQWVGFAIVLSLLGWFVLSKESRRYYRVSAK